MPDGMTANATPEELIWVGLGAISLFYLARLLRGSWRRHRALVRDGRNGRAGILLRGDAVMDGLLVALQTLLTLPGVLVLFRENPPPTPGRRFLIGLLIAAQVFITIFAWYRTRTMGRFYAYEEPPPPPSQSARQHEEVLGAIDGVRDEAAAGHGEAGEAQRAAGEARDEAAAAKDEATAAHHGAREILERIDDATQDRSRGDGGPS